MGIGADALRSSVSVMQMRHNSVVMYEESLYSKRYCNNRNVYRWKKLNQNQYSGMMTVGVRKRMTKALNVMLQVIKPQTLMNPVTKRLMHHKLSFITLKISQEGITGRQAYDNVFCHFLDWLTRTKKVEHYVWKLEGGLTHYHITTPAFIHYQEIQDTWNAFQRKAGYLDAYAQEFGHFKPNSTDIHEVLGITDLAAYIVKAFAKSLEAAERLRLSQKGVKPDITAEMGKEIQNQEAADSKIWGCSEVLSAACYCKFYMETVHHLLIAQLKREQKIREISDDKNYRWVKWTFTDSSPPEILEEHQKLYMKYFLQWQMCRPSKSASEETFAVWQAKKPVGDGSCF